MLKKIEIEQLKPGMFIVDSGLSWIDHPFLYSEGGEIKSEEQINSIIAEGYAEAFVDTDKGSFPWREKLTVEEQGGFASAMDRHKGYATDYGKSQQVPLQTEFETAKRIYSESLNFARNFIASIQRDREIDYQKSEKFVTQVIASVVRNKDALLSLSKLKTYDQYTYTHCINVTVLAASFGDFLGLAGSELHELGLTALFHDIGKAAIPDEILNKPGKLTAQEFEVIKKHSRAGYDMLKQRGGTSGNILKGVLEHHEKYNGQGYPQGLQGEEISLFARIISLADVYDAMTSNRVYKRAIIPHKALSIVYGMRSKDFYPKMAEQFIKCLGIYPPGSLVSLNSHNFAVVLESNNKQPLHPKIKLILDSKMREIPPQTIDLANQSGQGKELLAITDCLMPEEYSLDISKYLP